MVSVNGPDRPLGGAFGSLTLRELYTAVALLGHTVAKTRDLWPGRAAARDAEMAVEPFQPEERQP
jgi:hypothetical protein